MHASRRPGLSIALRPLELPALAATIPAFYMALLSQARGAMAALYLAAAVAVLTGAWREQIAHSRHRSAAAVFSRPVAYALWLGAALLLCAALPEGDAPALIGLRLAATAGAALRIGALMRPWFSRGGLPQLLLLALGVLGLCGLGFWWLEPSAQTFGDGLWLAFTTAATVGYGDIVPTAPAAKIFAVFVVLLGFGVLSLVTASIAAMWVESEERRIEHDILREMRMQLQQVQRELAALRRERAGGREPASMSARNSAVEP